MTNEKFSTNFNSVSGHPFIIILGIIIIFYGGYLFGNRLHGVLN